MACFAPDCYHNFHSSGCKFFRFPTEYDEREKWIQSIRRSDKTPNESSRLCSCHFVRGKRENGPTKFSWNSKGIIRPVPVPKIKKLKRCKEPTNDIPNKKKSNHAKNAYGHANKVYKNTEYEIAALRTENNDLRKKINDVKKPFGVHCISKNEKLFSYYTGLTEEEFNNVLDLCSKSPIRFFFGWEVNDVDVQNQLLITLMKLRLNLDYLDLSVRFDTTEDIISNIVLTFVKMLHDILFVNMLNQTLPNENDAARRILIGYVIFDTAVPTQNIQEEKLNNKHKNTMKGLIAIEPNGVIRHCGQLYPGSTADFKIKNRSGIASKFKNTKLVSINGDRTSDNALLVNDAETYAQTIKRLRSFGILNFIPKPLFVHSSIIFQLCAALTNFVNPEFKRIETETPSSSTSLDFVEQIDVCDNFVDCIKTEIKEEEVDLDLDVESNEHIGDFNEIYCKSESEDEVMECNVELER